MTVLFADIVDSSGTTRTYDAEILRAALGRTFARIREILIEHGGTVEKFIGDAVMAVFGVPAAHEDDAERAVRAAIAIRQLASASPAGVSPGFILRIGINSGEVVTGDGEGAEFLVTGTPVIVGARLEENAKPGEILVGPLTREMTRSRISYGPIRPINARGVGIIESAGVIAVSSEFLRRVVTPFVGRESELRLLSDVHARVRSTRRPHLVTVFGDPGIGKSRLATEFLRRTSPPVWARIACLPYGQAITYWPFQMLIRGEAGISPTDARDAAQAKVEAKVAALMGDSADSRRVSRALTALVLSHDAATASDVTADERRAEIAQALASYLEARFGSSLGAIVLEDLHWAQDPLLALIEDLLEHLRAPLVLVCLARPDLLERRPTWGAGRTNALALALEPLEEHETERLTRELVRDRTDIPVSDVVARTEGNPLFVEEYVRMLLENGSRANVPPTLHGVIAARIDATRPPVKQLLQEASVIGREFSLDALPSVPSVADVAEAERRGLVIRTARRGPSGSQLATFCHVLTADVAYSSLSKAERSAIHDHYSRWLEATGAERAQEYAEVVAFHAERAFALAHELDLEGATELGHRAFAGLSQAASAATARGELRTARELNTRALAVAETVGVDPTDHAAAQALGAIIRLRLDADSAAIAELDEAIARASAIGPSEDLIRLLVWKASSVAIFEDLAVSRALFEAAIQAAHQIGSDELVAYTMWSATEPVGIAGRLDEQSGLLEKALARIRAAGATQYEVSCLADLCVNAIERADLDRANDLASEAARLADFLGRRRDRFRAADALARVLLARGEERAVAAADDALRLAREIGGPGTLARAAEIAALARERYGDADGARIVLDEVLRQLDSERMPNQRAAIARLEAIRSRLALARDDLTVARQAAAAALAAAPKTHVAVRAVGQLAAAAIAKAEKRTEDAKALIGETIALLAPTQLHRLKAQAEQQMDSTSVRARAR